MSDRQSRKLERELAAYADGSLDPTRRERVERAVDASPALQADLAAQRSALDAIAAGRVSAPASLRARIELAPGPARGRFIDRFGTWTVAAAGAFALAMALVVTFAVVRGQGGALTVTQAAALSAGPPQQAVASVPSGAATVPGVLAAGLPYPAWGSTFGYSATGVRRDRLDGRLATTVYYQAGPSEVAYTIVSGAPLALGVNASASVRDGVALRSLSTGGHPVVTWVREGHTCVLTGRGVSVSALLALAAWRHGEQELY